jgi:tryptophan halogenase
VAGEHVHFGCMARARLDHVGVLGGGTAGYFAALALRARFPELAVTIVESSRIPIIGVGEATTPPLVAFLHHTLGLDVHELDREVQPTWKLGIHFAWGPPDGFDYPFSWGDLADAEAHDGSIARASLGTLLMRGRKGPVVRGDDGTLKSLLPSTRYAYHLDNRRFVAYLKKCADRAGIRYLDVEIADVKLREAMGDSEVDELITTDGQRLAFDFYIDSTGFRSLLIGKAFGSKFTSYASTLLCDRAVVADVPHDGSIKPFTLAETMDHGWCWNIPMRDCDHRGYVYASAFCTEEQAVAEMRAKNPGMSQHWSVKFRSGRHAEMWRGNTIAIGNAYGFVEPLESTALHMVIIEITQLLRALDADPQVRRDRETINQRVGAHWDYLRWFLGLHYRFNRRLDTPFWRTCRREVDITGLDEVVEDFKRNGPLSRRGVPTAEDSIFGAGGVDIMLLGQQVRPGPFTARFDSAAWDARCFDRERIAGRALTHREALDATREHPEFLDEMLHAPQGWCLELAREIEKA